MIPHNLIRTVPTTTTQEIEQWWTWAVEIHQGWNHMTFRDPIDRDLFPMTSHLWDRCQNGAQRAGLIRLEAVYTHGGVYIDSDVQVYKSFTPLTGLQAFAAWEDARVVPDAIFGAEQGHPAIGECLEVATWLVEKGFNAWDSGPGVFTDVLPGRLDVLLLPPASIYPYHYSEKNVRGKKGADWGNNPWCYAAHHWYGSWVPK
jgi:hypothetical protein